MTSSYRISMDGPDLGGVAERSTRPHVRVRSKVGGSSSNPEVGSESG